MNSSNKQAKPIPLDQLSYEQAFYELEAIVASLEANDRPLEEALALYERGQALARCCAEMLDKADLRVQVLSGEGLVDFAPPDQQ
ncbi:MAG TPA: exodeoxyribonuclease VII small subunit [Anaerolineales bacterium]|nr:exodeoxyribonuclease VII small subunit [Anaerolineales bacterium]